MRLPPPHPFLQQDTADLAAFDADACLFGRLRQRIQAPLSRPTLIASHHRPIPLRHQTTRRWLAGQGDDDTSFGFGQPRLASRTWLDPQSLDALLVETRDVNADGLGMAMQFCRNLIRGLARPAFHYHAGVPNPIGGGMLAAGQFADGSFFSLILRISCFDMFGHHSAPSSQKHSHFIL